jgi:ADP-heptose:LPS heptosyltransferase
LSRSRKREELRQSEVKSVLVVELTRLGDVVAMIPAIDAIQSHFQHSQVHILVSNRFLSLLSAIELDVQVHGVPEDLLAKGFMAGVSVARRIKPDLACSMSTARRNAAVVLASGAKYKVGYLTYLDSLTPYLVTTPVEGFGVILDTKAHYEMESIENRPLKVCHAMGVKSDETMERIALRTEDCQAISEQLRLREVIPPRKYVVIHPFSGWKYRTWSLEGFNALARMIVTKLEYAVVFICAQEEIHLLELSRKQLENQKDIHFFASQDVLETAVVLSGTSLFVGNDSGPLHLASSLGVPVVGLFGPAPPELTAPRRKGGVNLYKRLDCSPCDQRKCIRPEDPCMGLISSDEVFAAVTKTLSATRTELAAANV